MSDETKMWRAFSIGAFVLCLLMPGYYAEGTNLYGWFLFIFGLFGLPLGEIGWIANMALFMCWSTLTGAPRVVPLVCAIGAIVLALCFAAQDTAWSYNWSGKEAEFSLKIGYYTWVISMVLAAIAAFTNKTSKPNVDS